MNILGDSATLNSTTIYCVTSERTAQSMEKKNGKRTGSFDFQAQANYFFLYIVESCYKRNISCSLKKNQCVLIQYEVTHRNQFLVIFSLCIAVLEKNPSFLEAH